jgi:hypothetical protein
VSFHKLKINNRANLELRKRLTARFPNLTSESNVLQVLCFLNCPNASLFDQWLVIEAQSRRVQTTATEHRRKLQTAYFLRHQTVTLQQCSGQRQVWTSRIGLYSTTIKLLFFQTYHDLKSILKRVYKYNLW